MISDKDFEEQFNKIESFGKNANQRLKYLVPHLNDPRGSSIDKRIEAQTDFTFALMHYEKIVEQLKIIGLQLGLKT